MKISEYVTLADFFPVDGIFIGKTTWEEAEKIGYKIENPYNSGRYYGSRSIEPKIGKTFTDYGAVGKFTRFKLTHPNEFPAKWIAQGLSYKLSYQDWMKWFKEKRFDVKVIESPTIIDFCGRKTLSARVSAIDHFYKFRINLRFYIGNRNGEGCDITSPNSLFSIEFDFLN